MLTAHALACDITQKFQEILAVIFAVENRLLKLFRFVNSSKGAALFTIPIHLSFFIQLASVICS